MSDCVLLIKYTITYLLQNNESGYIKQIKEGINMKLAMGCDPAAYRFYKKLLERMKEEGYDIVIGSRFVGEKKPFTMRMLGSNLIEMAIRFTTGVNIKDPTSGMRMFSKRMIREFASGLNYGPEPDTVSYLIRQGARVAEVPVIMDAFWPI